MAAWPRSGSPRTRCCHGTSRSRLLLPELAVDDALRARFRNEAIAAAQLTHPNIVATYDTGDDDGVAYIVMELVDGMTLRQPDRPARPVART